MALVVRELLTVLGVKTDEASVRSFDRAVRSAKEGMKQASKGAGWLQSALGNLAAMGVQAATDAFFRLATGLFTANVEFEKLEAMLITVEGDVDKAGAAFARLRNFAKATPFELKNITEAFIAMRVRGLEASDRTLTALGDTMAAFGLDITEAGVLVGQLMAGETEKFKQLGGQASVSGNQITLQFKGMKKTIKKDAKSIEQFLVDLGETNFAGAMERQSKTLGGVLSNMADAMFEFAVAIGDAGARGEMKELLRTLLGGIGGFSGLAKVIGRSLARAIRTINRLLIYLGRNMETVKKVAVALGMALGTLALAKVVRGVWDLAKAMRGLSIAMALPTAEAAALALVFIAIAVVIGLIVLAIDDLLVFMRGGKSLFGEMMGENSKFAEQVRDSMIEASEATKKALKELGIAMEDIDVGVWDVIIGAIKFTILVVAALIVAIWKFGKAVMWISGEVTAFVIHFGDHMRELLNNIIVWFKNIGVFIEEAMRGIWKSLSETTQGIIDAIVTAFWAVVDGIVDVAVAIAEAFVAAFQWIVDLVVAFVDLIVETFWGIVDGVKEIAVAIGEAIAAAFQVVIDTIMGWLEDALLFLKEVVDLASEVVSEIEVFFGGEGEGGLAGRAAELAAAAQGATTAGAQTTTTNVSSVNVGEVSVTVPGTTDMGPGEVSSAAQQGVVDAFNAITRAQMRTL